MDNVATTQGTMRGATTEDVAARFRVTAQSVRTWARQGKIPAYRVGSQYRFDLDAVEEALRLQAGFHHG
jgi:excisionase family DNA binding protein